jgi:hypothetical protein
MMTVLMVAGEPKSVQIRREEKRFHLLMIMNYSDGRPGLDDICG